MLKQTVCVGVLWQILVPKVQIQSYMVTPEDHGKCIISQLWIFTNDTVIIRICALTKANSCDKYEQDTRKIVRCKAVTNPDLNISLY